MCAPCRKKTLICSHCDRGQIYCAGECVRKARAPRRVVPGQERVRLVCFSVNFRLILLTRHHINVSLDGMTIASTHTGRASAGRPRTSQLNRAEQLRLAKQKQRERDGKAGRTEARVKLPRALAQRLAIAARQPGFIDALTLFLDAETIDLERYPQLKLLCWNRRGDYLAAEDAWSLYERNWRFVEPDHLESAERGLIDTLSARFGAGMRHG